MKKFLAALLSVLFISCYSCASETSVSESSSDDSIYQFSLQSRALTVLNMDMKHRVYKYLRKKIKKLVGDQIKNIPDQIAYIIALQFFHSIEERPSIIDLLMLEEYIAQIESFSITSKMIKKKYALFRNLMAENGYGLENRLFAYILCFYRSKIKQLSVHLRGIDLYPMLTLVDVYDLMQKYVEQYKVEEVLEILFEIALSESSQLNEIIIRNISHVDENKTIIFTNHEKNNNFYIPSGVSQLKNIKQLFFVDNETVRLDSSVSKIDNIGALIVAYKKSVIFSDTFSQMKTLKSFMLKKMDTTNSDTSYLPRSVLENMPNLTHLHLEDRFNNMPELLEQISSLKHLSRLYITPDYHDSLPDRLESRITTDMLENGYFKVQNTDELSEKISFKKRSKSLGAITLTGSY